MVTFRDLRVLSTVRTQRSITEEELLENLGWVRALARRLVGDQADDLAQQVCVAALDRGQIAAPGAGGAGQRVRAWLARATVFLANKHRRGEQHRRDREQITARREAQPSTLDVVARNALLAKLVQAVNELDEPYRTTVLLRYLDELSTQEIAARAGVSEAAVRKRLSRGLARLRATLHERQVDRTALSAFVGFVPLRSLPLTLSSASTSAIGAMTMGSTLIKATAAASIVGGATLVVMMNAEDPVVQPQATETTKLEEAAVVRPADRPPILAEPSSDPLSVRVEVPAPDSTESIGANGARTPVSPPKEAVQAPSEADYQRMRRQEDLMAVMMDFEMQMAAEAQYLVLPEDGYRVETYEDGSRKAAGMIVDGHHDGEWQLWHATGPLEARGSYFAGKKQGLWTAWDEAGTEVERGEFLYGRREGAWHEVQGGMVTESDFRDGEKHGPRLQTLEDGNVAVQDAWFLNKRHGLASVYHPNSTLASQGEWVHGARVGQWDYWNTEGVLDEERSGFVELVDPKTRLLTVRKELSAQLESLEREMPDERWRWLAVRAIWPRTTIPPRATSAAEVLLVHELRRSPLAGKPRLRRRVGERQDGVSRAMSAGWSAVIGR